LNGVIRVDVSLYFIVSFLTFFLSGGLTGLWLSHVGLNLFVHDTFYVVAHFHFMFSCATFSALFAGFYFYYKEFFGVEYSKPIATLHYLFWTIGQWLTFTPLYWVGYNGLPRRYHDYPVMYMGWHGLSSSGHMLTMLSIVFFLIGILESKFRKKSPTYYHGVPRTFKRVQYETLKNIELQKTEMYSYRVRTKTFEWEN
jgi:cytochrome c oxidase subunit 1